MVNCERRSKSSTSAGTSVMRRDSSGDGAGILATQQNAEVVLPGADRLVIGRRHAREDLARVIQVVDCPGGEQVAHRDVAQARVISGLIEVGIGHELVKRGQVLRSQLLKAIEELIEGYAAVALEHRVAIELVERLCRAVLEDALDARDPV